MRLSRYNQSHDKDLTAYKAIRNIEKKIKKSAIALCRMLFGVARMSGFDIVSPIRLRHQQTGTRIDIEDKEAKAEDASGKENH